MDLKIVSDSLEYRCRLAFLMGLINALERDFEQTGDRTAAAEVSALKTLYTTRYPEVQI